MTPYTTLPDYSFWERVITSIDAKQIDPIINVPFKIKPEDRIATAGSCFARRITKYLKTHNYNILITEQLPPHLNEYISSESKEKYGYDVFTARYDNIYTNRQLLQLFLRAFGEFVPQNDIWKRSDGTYVDAFRPKINPDGYPDKEQVISARETHFACVREMFSTLDVFIFTMGLTEAWMSKQDGSIYPIVPGVAGGEFSTNEHAFINFKVNEIINDVSTFIERIRGINPYAKIILTVSPTPMLATATKEHVLVATIGSKSALRAACTEICQAHENVAYFPSYELVAGGVFTGERTYKEDKRTPSDEIIAKIMKLFTTHYCTSPKSNVEVQKPEPNGFESAVQAMCDDIL